MAFLVAKSSTGKTNLKLASLLAIGWEAVLKELYRQSFHIFNT